MLKIEINGNSLTLDNLRLDADAHSVIREFLAAACEPGETVTISDGEVLSDPGGPFKPGERISVHDREAVDPHTTASMGSFVIDAPGHPAQIEVHGDSRADAMLAARIRTLLNTYGAGE